MGMISFINQPNPWASEKQASQEPDVQEVVMVEIEKPEEPQPEKRRGRPAKKV